jgi:hypothetical protein
LLKHLIFRNGGSTGEIENSRHQILPKNIMFLSMSNRAS